MRFGALAGEMVVSPVVAAFRATPPRYVVQLVVSAVKVIDVVIAAPATEIVPRTERPRAR